MMILNLINVIAIAIGIGSSVNNTNFDIEKKTRKNAIQTVNTTWNEAQVGESVNIYDNENLTNYEYTKYVLEGTVNAIENYLMIQNTSYCENIDRHIINNNYYENTNLYTIYKITNFYDSVLTFTLNMESQTTVGVGIDIRRSYYTFSPEELNIDNYINMTLSNRLPSTFAQLRTEIAPYRRYYNREIIATTTNPTDDSISTQQITLNRREQITIIFLHEIYKEDANEYAVQKTIPTTLNFSGSVAYPDYDQEIVDIPGLMFTILTLPFSFISQAFDLTVFPNTPYQINFTNLFMTILAIFILIWIIKHIFK